MSFNIKELEIESEFFDKINKDINQFILELNFHIKKSLFKTKIPKNKTIPEFYNCYSNQNAIILFGLLDKIDKIYSNFFFQNITNNLNSEKEKYILDLSNIILLFNLVSKNMHIITKIIKKAESYLTKVYSENHIINDMQKKLNNYINNLINIKKKKKKILSTFHIFNKSIRRKTEKATNSNLFPLIKSIDENVKDNNEKIIKVTFNINKNINNNTNNNKLLNEEKMISDLNTPKFNNKILDDKKFDDTKINDNYDSTKNEFIKQESIHSYYTLASKAAHIIQDNNPKIYQEKEEKKMHEETKEKHIINSNKPNTLDNQNECEAKLIYTKSNVSEVKKKKNNNQNKNNPRKQIFSSINLKSSMEKEMLKNFLIFINNIYKAGAINNEEKLKLKKLIISKSEKIENIYNIFYKVDKNKFVNELKKLII